MAKLLETLLVCGQQYNDILICLRCRLFFLTFRLPNFLEMNKGKCEYLIKCKFFLFKIIVIWFLNSRHVFFINIFISSCSFTCLEVLLFFFYNHKIHLLNIKQCIIAFTVPTVVNSTKWLLFTYFYAHDFENKCLRVSNARIRLSVCVLWSRLLQSTVCTMNVKLKIYNQSDNCTFCDRIFHLQMMYISKCAPFAS